MSSETDRGPPWSRIGKQSPAQTYQSERVLVAMGTSRSAAPSLLFAQLIAEGSNSTLTVLRVGGDLRLQGPASQRRRRKDPVPRNADPGHSLTPTLLPVEYLSRSDEFERAVQETCNEYPTNLVVVPPSIDHVGQRVTRIAASARVPVLAPKRVRLAALPKNVVVGVEPANQATPLLRSAAAVARRFAARMIAVYNLPPCLVLEKGDRIHERVIRRQPGELLDALQRLTEMARAVDPLAETVVTTDTNPARAIIRVARERQADLVVVKAEREKMLNGHIGGGLPERVVDHASQSVLAIPVP